MAPLSAFCGLEVGIEPIPALDDVVLRLAAQADQPVVFEARGHIPGQNALSVQLPPSLHQTAKLRDEAVRRHLEATTAFFNPTIEDMP